jgi:hypothetical protein
LTYLFSDTLKTSLIIETKNPQIDLYVGYPESNRRPVRKLLWTHILASSRQ